MASGKHRLPDPRHECPACREAVPFDPELNVPRFHMCETPLPEPCTCRHSRWIHEAIDGECGHYACHCTGYIKP